MCVFRLKNTQIGRLTWTGSLPLTPGPPDALVEVGFMLLLNHPDFAADYQASVLEQGRRFFHMPEEFKLNVGHETAVESWETPADSVFAFPNFGFMPLSAFLNCFVHFFHAWCRSIDRHSQVEEPPRFLSPGQSAFVCHLREPFNLTCILHHHLLSRSTMRPTVNSCIAGPCWTRCSNSTLLDRRTPRSKTSASTLTSNPTISAPKRNPNQLQPLFGNASFAARTNGPTLLSCPSSDRSSKVTTRSARNSDGSSLDLA